MFKLTFLPRRFRSFRLTDGLCLQHERRSTESVRNNNNNCYYKKRRWTFWRFARIRGKSSGRVSPQQRPSSSSSRVLYIFWSSRFGLTNRFRRRCTKCDILFWPAGYRQTTRHGDNYGYSRIFVFRSNFPRRLLVYILSSFTRSVRAATYIKRVRF